MATRLLSRSPIHRPHRIPTFRHRSNGPGEPHIPDPNLAGVDVADSVRRLEDALHEIAVRRSAPAWLPFLPGSSYWAPPRRRQATADCLAALIGSVSDDPTAATGATSIKRGPGYFSQGLLVPPHPIEENLSERNTVKSDDEEA